MEVDFGLPSTIFCPCVPALFYIYVACHVQIHFDFTLQLYYIVFLSVNATQKCT